MSSPEENTQQQEELTPEALQIIGKARRSFGFSIAILLLGFIAVVFALVYRATRDSEPADMSYPMTAINVPVGAELVSVAPGDGRVLVTYTLSGDIIVQVLDASTGEKVQDIPVSAE